MIIKNRALKMSVCFVIILALCFGFIGVGFVHPKAEAAALTLTAGGYAVLATLLGMFGITIASPQILKDLSSAIIDGSSAIKDWIEDIAENATGGGTDPQGNPEPNQFQLNLAGNAGLALLVNKIKSLFGNNTNIGEFQYSVDNMGYVGGVAYTTLTSFSSAEEAYAYAVYDYRSVTQASPITYTVNGVTETYYFKQIPNDSRICLYSTRNGDFLRGTTLMSIAGNGFYDSSSMLSWYLNSTRWTGSANGSANGNVQSLVGFKLGFRAIATSDGGLKLFPYVAAEYIRSSNATVDTYAIVPTFYGSDYVPISISGESVTPYYTDATYQNLTEFGINAIYTKLLEKLQNGNIQIDYSEALEYVNANQNTALNLQQQELLNQAQILDALRSMQAQQGEPTTTTLNEADPNVPTLPSLADKFPFCVPFDLIHLIGALNATSQEPIWTIPFVIPSLNINESFEFDLTEFEPVAAVIRVFVVLFFVLGLILITRKIIQA